MTKKPKDPEKKLPQDPQCTGEACEGCAFSDARRRGHIARLNTFVMLEEIAKKNAC